MVMASILDSIKKMCGISEDDQSFNEELIIYVNTVLSILTQLGVGPSEGFSIVDSGNTWVEFLGQNKLNFELIKTYVYLKVRLMFDPPQNSFLVDAIKSQISELEWRIELNSSLDTESIQTDPETNI